MRLLTIFLFVVFAVSNVYGSKHAAMQAAQKQVDCFKEAVKTRDRNTTLNLFHVVREDYFKIDEVFSAFESANLEVNNAKIYDNKMEMNLKLNGHSMKWLMEKNTSSPTGWKVYAVQQAPSKIHRKNSFTMCYVGLFWCIIEHVIKIADG